MKILLVDDDPDLLSVTSFALQQAGMLVVSANSFGSALAVFRSEHPDLAILDINLPGGSGFDLCQAMRRETSSAQTTVKSTSRRLRMPTCPSARL